MQVVNDSAERAILLAKPITINQPQTQTKDLIIPGGCHAATKNSRLAEIYTTEDKLGR